MIDASALVDGITKEEVELPVRDSWHAPHHVDAEVVSTLRRRALSGVSTVSDAREGIDWFLAFEIERHALRRLAPRMWSLRDDLTAYDAAYVALAESLGAPLVTTDVRLARTARRYCEVIVP